MFESAYYCRVADFLIFLRHVNSSIYIYMWNLYILCFYNIYTIYTYR